MGKQIGIFVGGVQILKPSVLPLIDTSPMVPGGVLPGGIPLMIVVADGGDPTKIYEFSSVQEAKNTLRAGRCLNYISRAFNPSPDKTNAPGANSIKVIRAGSRTAQGKLAIVADPPPPIPPLPVGVVVEGVTITKTDESGTFLTSAKIGRAHV
jgi:hypothetical protein